MSAVLDRLESEINGLLQDKATAEAQCEKYADIIERVENYLNNLSSFESDKSTFESDIQTMESSPDSAEGKLNTTFVDKLGVVRTEMEDVMEAIEAGYTETLTQLEAARQQYSSWLDEVSQLDQQIESRRREYREEEAREQAGG